MLKEFRVDNFKLLINGINGVFKPPPQNGFMEAAVALDRELLIVTGGAFAEKTVLLENIAGCLRLLDEQ